MPSYTYRARREDGRLAQGKLRAASEERASALLLKNSLTPISITKEKEEHFWEKDILGGRVGAKDLILFTRQTGAMVHAGVPIVESLQTLEKQVTRPGIQKVLQEMAYEIEAGDSLSNAMARHPQAFNPFIIGITRTGEASGRLSSSLMTLADYLERDYDFVRRVRSALVYPVFVVFVVIILSIVMFTFILPQLVQLFEESAVVLPWPTRVLIAVANFIQSYWLLLLGLSIVCAFVARSYYKTPEGHYTLNTLLLRIPILSGFFQKFYLARLTSILHTLFSSDVPVLQSLMLAKDAVSNGVYQRILDNTVSSIKDGASISSIWKNEPYIPPILTSMIGVGERSGELQKGFSEASRFFQRDVDSALNTVTTLIEPILIIVLGIGVAIVVAAVLLPIYNLVLVL